jgi:all-trans-retinol dehydrogenase (NAD+)
MAKKDHGMIVTVASFASFLTLPNMVDDSASKAASLAFHEGLSGELLTRHNAPRVRTVVVNQGYTKTPLFTGFNNSSAFLLPSMEPETVAEAIVKKVLTGKSGQVIIPGAGALLALQRGFPHWYQIGLRSRSEKSMSTWNGRQVIDVEKWNEDKESE